jgi:hypothetical protein
MLPITINFSLLKLQFSTVKVRVKVMLLLMVIRPVSLGVKPHLGPQTIFLLLLDSCRFEDVGCLL